MIDDPVLRDCVQRLKTAYRKRVLFEQAADTELPHALKVAAVEAATAPAVLLEALREYYDPNLPKIFRNGSGREVPGDRSVIEKMATARGQVLNDEHE